MQPATLLRRCTTGTILGIACLTGCLQSGADRLERNKEIVRRNAEAINDRDLEAIDATMAEGLVRHSQATPGPDMQSLQEFKTFLASDWASFPDSKITIEHMAIQPIRLTQVRRR